MHRALPFAATLLLAATVFAQTSTQGSVPVTAHITVLNATANCPVGFFAGHSAGLTELRAKDAKPGLVSQSLNIQMSNTGPHDIVSAQVTVHGLAPNARLAPATANSAVAPTGLTKQLALNLPVAAGHHAATDLRVEGFTSVQRIDLDSVAFADGTTWNASPQQRCSIVPNGVMLVAAAQ